MEQSACSIDTFFVREHLLSPYLLPWTCLHAGLRSSSSSKVSDGPVNGSAIKLIKHTVSSRKIKRQTIPVCWNGFHISDIDEEARKMEQTKEVIMRRIAENYVKLFLSVKSIHKDDFFNFYHVRSISFRIFPHLLNICFSFQHSLFHTNRFHDAPYDTRLGWTCTNSLLLSHCGMVRLENLS